MVWLQGFLTELISAIVRPIIREEINELKGFIANQLYRAQAYEKYDKEATELAEAMAKASTSEERWAILQRIKNARAGVDI